MGALAIVVPVLGIYRIQRNKGQYYYNVKPHYYEIGV